MAGAPVPYLALGRHRDLDGPHGLVLGPTIPLIATEVVSGHGPRTLGLVNSAMGAGMVAGALIAMRVRPVRPLRAGAAALLLCWLQPASVPLGLPVSLIAAGLAAAGAANAFWGVMWTTSVLTQVPANARSRVHAYEVAGSVAMTPVGQVLAGPASDGPRHRGRRPAGRKTHPTRRSSGYARCWGSTR